MFKVTRKLVLNSGRIHIGYGIKCSKYRFDDISAKRKKVILLCQLCNRFDLAEEQLENVVEDFLVDFNTKF